MNSHSSPKNSNHENWKWDTLFFFALILNWRPSLWISLYMIDHILLFVKRQIKNLGYSSHQILLRSN